MCVLYASFFSIVPIPRSYHEASTLFPSILIPFLEKSHNSKTLCFCHLLYSSPLPQAYILPSTSVGVLLVPDELLPDSRGERPSSLTHQFYMALQTLKYFFFFKTQHPCVFKLKGLYVRIFDVKNYKIWIFVPANEGTRRFWWL